MLRSKTMCRLTFFAGSLALLVGCGAPEQPSASQSSQATIGPSTPTSGSPVSINAAMVALVDHAGHELWELERDGKAPKSADEWANAEEHATQLAAAGSLITLPGTGPNDKVFTSQPGWQKWSRALSDAGLAAIKATQAKDQSALVAANGRVVEACEGCHKEFKPALPSEGINHRHVH